MTRETKFRAWHIVGSTVMYGDEYGMSYSQEQNCCVWDDIVSQKKSHVMQYTGFKDKSGAEIYDGDILSYHRTSDGLQKQGIVEFDEKVGAWYCGGNLLSSVLHEQNNDERKKEQNHIINENQYAIVIGNVYENANLLSPSQ